VAKIAEQGDVLLQAQLFGHIAVLSEQCHVHEQYNELVDDQKRVTAATSGELHDLVESCVKDKRIKAGAARQAVMGENAAERSQTRQDPGSSPAEFAAL